MITSIVHLPGVEYPAPDEFFSPSELYPEYIFSDLATKPNIVYRMVREAMAQAGLDREHFGTSEWNPFGCYITPGQRVFILCNFVCHRGRTESLGNFYAKCTHGSVLRAVADYTLIALKSPGKSTASSINEQLNGNSKLNICGSISFGNSGLQSSNFERVLFETGAGAVYDFYRERGMPVKVKDLRLLVTERGVTGRSKRKVIQGNSDCAVEVTLDGNSLLWVLDNSCSAEPQYRVADYDPECIRAFHSKGRHRYYIHRDILESDVVLSLPKLKVHEKVGITCGLKGFVGTVARKEGLPHHRYGSTKEGGDEYASHNPLLRIHSWMGDWINHGKTHSIFVDKKRYAPIASSIQFIGEIVYHTLGRFLRKIGLSTSGAWHGNDTCWRMALDIARIVHFADSTGEMQNVPVRKNIMMIDGIVGGEGSGPLSPSSVPSSCVLFSDDVAWGDSIACRLMGFDPIGFPLLSHSESLFHCRGNASGAKEMRTIIKDGKRIKESEIAPVICRAFSLPAAWKLTKK